MSNLTITFILLGVVIATVVLSQIFVSKGIVNYFTARKVLHIIAISLTAFSVYIADHDLLFWIAVAVVPILFILVLMGVFNLKDQPQNSWGIFYFAVVFLMLIWIFPKQPASIFFPLIILALSDGSAALIGFYRGRHWYSFGYESKSIEGSVTFFLVTVFCLQFLPRLVPFLSIPFASVYTVLIVSLFITILEAISIRGRDNLWIPIGVLYWMLLDTNFIGFLEISIFIGLGIIMYLIYKLKWLTSGGALAASFLGWMLLISPAPIWIIPTIVFLLIGTLISKLPKGEVQIKSDGRNANQVFSNGGIYVVFLGLYFITHQMFFLVGGLASLTAAMSDTASSEIGSRYGSRTFYITNGRKVAPGLSGGISWIGTLAGAIFAALFACIPLIIFGKFDPEIFLILFGIGLFGNFFDSFLGALVQVKYRENHQKPWQDQNPGTPQVIKKGHSFMTNDIVNLLTTSLVALLGAAIYMIL